MTHKHNIITTIVTNTTAYSGNAHLNSEGGMITNWFDHLSLQDLLVRNQLHLGM